MELEQSTEATETTEEMQMETDEPLPGPSRPPPTPTAVAQNTQLEPRNYQKVLISLAQERNIIACLPTGAGKTLIALKLSDTYFDVVKGNRKKIVFLACTIPLLKQQHALFEKYTCFQCNAFSGSGTEKFKTDSKKAFHEKYDSCEVILMTPEYFNNMLVHGFILFEEICLLIFDECHHAVGGGSMTQIMDTYSKIKAENSDYPLPRILGLSATIVSKNVGMDELPSEIAAVEKRLDCIAVTYNMLEEVQKHSTNAKVECVKYALSQLQLPGYNERDFLAPLSKAAEFFRSLPKDFKYDEAHKRRHPSEPRRWLFNGKSLGNTLATLFDECSLINPDLGPFGVIHVVVVKIRLLEDKMVNVTEHDEGILKLYNVALTSMKYFLVRARELFPMAFENKSIEHLLSDKVHKVLEILDKYSSKVGTEDALCGLLFVDRRTIALAMKEIIFHLKKTNPSKYDFIRPAVIFGTNSQQKSSAIDRVKVKELTEIMTRFRSNELNLLICTSVLEEGLDVPSCNLVVRFDHIPTVTSFIQSMGRARRKNSKYMVLLHAEGFDTGSSRIGRFGIVNKQLTDTLKEHLEAVMKGTHVQDFDEEDLDEEDISNHIPDFCPNGLLAARVTARTCVSLCNRYGATVTKNQIKSWNWFDAVTFSEVVESESNVNTKYQASITLPEESAVKEVIIKGEPMPDMKMAKQAAYMEACKRIYAAGGFDKHFLPLLNPKHPPESRLSQTSEALENIE